MIHGVLLLAMLLYICAAEIVIPHEPRNLGPIFPIAFGAVSLLIIGVAIYFRRTKLEPAVESLQSNPSDAKALQQWRIGGILTATLLDAVALFGFTLRFLGAGPKASVPFYIVAIGMMLLWWPQRP
jgi:hypothetical protein